MQWCEDYFVLISCQWVLGVEAEGLTLCEIICPLCEKAGPLFVSESRLFFAVIHNIESLGGRIILGALKAHTWMEKKLNKLCTRNDKICVVPFALLFCTFEKHQYLSYKWSNNLWNDFTWLTRWNKGLSLLSSEILFKPDKEFSIWISITWF